MRFAITSGPSLTVTQASKNNDNDQKRHRKDDTEIAWMHLHPSLFFDGRSDVLLSFFAFPRWHSTTFFLARTGL